jgi:Cu(I)/Ag(I) efflux system membrane fusion protein
MLQCGEIREQIAEAKSIPLDEEGNETMAKVVEAYFSLQTALAEDSVKKANEAAKDLAALIPEIDKAALANPKGKFLLTDISESLRSFVERIIESDSLTLQRVEFKSVSSSIEQLVAVFGGNLSQSVYKAHCPMAFNDQGADWLQSSKDILNPYFGAEMLKCGEIKEQLAGAKEDGNTDQ